MKSKSHMWLLLLITMVFLLTLVAATPHKSQSNPWKGKWWSIDPYDDSLQSVVFLGSNQFKYVDRGASICGVDEFENPIYRADAKGSGSLSDFTLTGSAVIRCFAHPTYNWGELPFVWTYDPVTNTMSDGITAYTRSRP